MANRTDPAAKSVHGTNPQNLVEKILRTKIYQNAYWKEQCFGLTAETLVDKAMELDHFGGTFGGNNKATPFMCLTLKMLQIQPDKEIVVEFIKNEDYKYVRVLGAFYLRLVALPTDVFHYLEPLYNDYRKLRRRLTDGSFALIHVDEFVDELLTKDYACDVSLPRLPKRWNLETSGQLEPRKSALEDDFEEEEEQPEEEEEPVVVDDRRGRDRKRDYYRDRERDPYDYDRGRGGRERERERDRDRDYYREKERDRDYYHRRDRRRSRSRDRDRERDRDRDYYERSKRRRSASPEERKRGRDDEKRKKEKKAAPAVTDGTDHPDPEIAEANKLRAALGLKPLRP